MGFKWHEQGKTAFFGVGALIMHQVRLEALIPTCSTVCTINDEDGNGEDDDFKTPCTPLCRHIEHHTQVIQLSHDFFLDCKQV